MILDVVTYPNKILRQKSIEISNFDSVLHNFLDDMYDTMIEKNGVGLAAIQVANPIRVLIVNIPREEDNTQYKEDLLEVINPEILDTEGSIVWSEGCLSVPGFYEDVNRHDRILLRYKDRFGNAHEEWFSGFTSVALQHEIDHLNGVLFVDKLSLIKRKKFEKELKKNMKAAATTTAAESVV